ncbi:MAG: hypothetical protein ACK559_39235, partial [bacterium]
RPTVAVAKADSARARVRRRGETGSARRGCADRRWRARRHDSLPHHHRRKRRVHLLISAYSKS